MLRAEGETAPGGRWEEMWPVLALLGAWLVAALAWIWALALHHPVRTRAPAAADIIRAIHGERSNRTRALLPPAVPVDPATTYLILGRPRASLARLAAELGLAADPRAVLFRAGSWSAGLASLRTLPRLFGEGVASLRRTPVLPAWSELVTICYRMQMGACHAVWWEAAGIRAGCILYGHTGLADTTALELAQQAGGARTVHLVHGISAGWNFTGYSSLGVFQCGFDAEWHARLPNYGATSFPPTEMPSARPGGSGWVICSNLLHPMNPALASEGAAPELRLLDLVAAAARLAAHPPARIVWKPHPTFRTLAPAIRDAALARVAELGFEVWDEAEGLPALADYRTVLTTPSTVALDAMRLGKLPIVVSTDGDVPETVIGAFPRGGQDAASLAREIARLESAPTFLGEFQRVWRGVGPGASLESEFLRVLSMEPRRQPFTAGSSAEQPTGHRLHA
jgi:hypothetical protein